MFLKGRAESCSHSAALTNTFWLRRVWVSASFHHTTVTWHTHAYSRFACKSMVEGLGTKIGMVPRSLSDRTSSNLRGQEPRYPSNVRCTNAGCAQIASQSISVLVHCHRTCNASRTTMLPQPVESA